MKFLALFAAFLLPTAFCYGNLWECIEEVVRINEQGVRGTSLTPASVFRRQKDRNAWSKEDMRAPKPLTEEIAKHNSLARHYYFYGDQLEKMPQVKHAFDATVAFHSGGFKGSGALIEGNRIVTAYHVEQLVNFKNGWIVVEGKKVSLTGAKVVDSSKEDDLSVIHVPNLASIDHKSLKVSDDYVTHGSPLFIVGHPQHDRQFLVDQDKVVSVATRSNNIAFRRETSMSLEGGNIRLGSSGGPVVNEKGEIVGIVRSGSPNQHGWTERSEMTRRRFLVNLLEATDSE